MRTNLKVSTLSRPPPSTSASVWRRKTLFSFDTADLCPPLLTEKEQTFTREASRSEEPRAPDGVPVSLVAVHPTFGPGWVRLPGGGGGGEGVHVGTLPPENIFEIPG